MPENSWPTSEELFRGDRDHLGFEIIHVAIVANAFGVRFAELTIPLKRVVYDQMREDDPKYLNEYITYLVAGKLMENLTVTMAVNPYGRRD